MTDNPEEKFPKGSMVKRNVMGATAKQVVGHKGNMLELEDGTLLHVSKAVRVESRNE
jgi:hypothetical protein